MNDAKIVNKTVIHYPANTTAASRIHAGPGATIALAQLLEFNNMAGGALYVIFTSGDVYSVNFATGKVDSFNVRGKF